MFTHGRAAFTRFALAAGAVVLVAALASFVVYGIPLPIVRAMPLDFGLGALWLALFAAFLIKGRGTRGRVPLHREGT